MFSIDASQIRQLEDGRPLVVDEDETLFKILYRLPSFGMDKIEAWSKTGVDWAELAEQPAVRRLEVFLIEGRATGVQRLDLPAEMAARLEYSCYFRVRLQLAGVPYPVLVCCRAVPRVWESASQLDEPASCYGLFLKTGGDESGRPELIFAAERVAWLPQRPEPSRGVTPSIVYLASLGMDAGLFDSVRNTNRKAITGEDRECFYQLLAAIGRADTCQPPFSSADLFSPNTMDQQVLETWCYSGALVPHYWNTLNLGEEDDFWLTYTNPDHTMVCDPDNYLVRLMNAPALMDTVRFNRSNGTLQQGAYDWRDDIIVPYSHASYIATCKLECSGNACTVATNPWTWYSDPPTELHHPFFWRKDVVARAGTLIAVCSARDRKIESYSRHLIPIPRARETAEPMLTVLPLQLLAYHAADFNGTDVDQPRNLAKSVTVE